MADSKKKKVEIGISDDYASMSCGDLDFYYGYERTMCPECGSDPTDDECEHEARAWCFTAVKGGKEIMRVPEYELNYGKPEAGKLENVTEFLLEGIGRFLLSRRV